MNHDVVVQFAAWVDRALNQKDLSPVVAYNFNLYEHQNETAVQLVGATFYDSTNEDWASNAYFSSGEDLFKLPHSLTGHDWEDVQRFAVRLVQRYLQRSALPGPLKTCHAVTVGFVDGSLETVYLRRDAQQIVEPERRKRPSHRS